MFKVKKNPVRGQCRAMRCKEGVPDGELCGVHYEAWKGAGEPDLNLPQEDAPKTSTGTGLAVYLPEDKQNALALERKQAANWLERIQNMPLKTQEQMDLAGKIRGAAALRIKELEEQRTSAVGPLNQVVKTINSWFSPNKDFFQAIVRTVDKRLERAHLEIKQAQAKALAVIEEAGGKADAATLLIAHETPVLPEQVRVQNTFTFTVEDFSKLPDEYKLINVTKIQAAVNAGGLSTAIPGVTVRESASLAGTGKG